MVEDGVHYLEDGHFWVEVPGIPEEEEEEEDDPSFPFHPPTRLTFSTHPVQVCVRVCVCVRCFCHVYTKTSTFFSCMLLCYVCVCVYV